MAIAYTLATLKSSVIAWLEEDGTEFSDALNNIIDLAERQVVKDLSFSIFDETATGTLTTATLTKPTGWVATIDLFVTESGEQRLLEPKPWGYVNLYGGAGAPLYFAETSETTITVAPAPTSAPYTMRYIKRPTSLVDTANPGTTWLSENAGEALFFACILNSEHFRKADERLESAKAFYAASIASVKEELRHLSRKEYA